MIVIDVETSGTNPYKNSILSIGALDFNNPENQFYQECQIFEGAEISQEALKVNGFTEQEIKNKKNQEEVIKEFIEWLSKIEDITIMGMNPMFDRNFLDATIKRYKINFNLGYKTIDLHSICYIHLLKREIKISTYNNSSALSTDNILNYVGLPSEPKPHNALNGAKLEAEAFSRLIFNKNLLKEFEKYKIPEYLID